MEYDFDHGAFYVHTYVGHEMDKEDPCSETECIDVLGNYIDSEYECDRDNSDNVSICSCETDLSFAAPTFSPCVIDESEIMPSPCTNIEPRSSLHSNYEVNICSELDSEGECLPTRVLDWKGFKLVGDNIDKSIRPSFQRYSNTTNSLHYFHYYALLDRLDLSKCLESLPTTVLNLRQLLVNSNDIQQIENDAVVLFSRFVRLGCVCGSACVCSIQYLCM